MSFRALPVVASLTFAFYRVLRLADIAKPFATLIAVIATYGGGGYCGRCVCERSGMSRRDSIRSILARGSALVRSLCSLRRPASPGSCGAGFM